MTPRTLDDESVAEHLANLAQTFVALSAVRISHVTLDRTELLRIRDRAVIAHRQYTQFLRYLAALDDRSVVKDTFTMLRESLKL